VVAATPSSLENVRKKPRVILAQKRITGKMERIWVGIALKSEAGEASEASSPLLGKTSETNEKIEKGEIFCGIEEPASPASLASATSPVEKPSPASSPHASSQPTANFSIPR
jgi:hypothetical protein